MSELFTVKNPAWLEGEVRNADIILSTRVRVARNIENFSFPNWANEKSLRKIINLVQDIGEQSKEIGKLRYYNFKRLSEINQKFLVERHQISPTFFSLSNTRGVLLEETEQTSVMVNEEDHIRLQAIQPGLSIKKAWKKAARLEKEFGKHLAYCKSDRYGYLTACPTNVGTGIRISFFCHLPGLSITNQMEDFLKYVIPAGIAIRGIYGEGSDTTGNIFQISNETTLGFSEEEIIERLAIIAKKIVTMERNARKKLLQKTGLYLEDKVYRAIGIIRSAKMLTTLELLSLLSALRLGKNIGIIIDIPHSLISRLIVMCQPMHIQKMYSKRLNEEEINVYRAEFLRKTLGLKGIMD